MDIWSVVVEYSVLYSHYNPIVFFSGIYGQKKDYEQMDCQKLILIGMTPAMAKALQK